MVFLFKSRLEAGSTVGPASSRPKTPLCYLAAYLMRSVLSTQRGKFAASTVGAKPFVPALAPVLERGQISNLSPGPPL